MKEHFAVNLLADVLTKYSPHSLREVCNCLVLCLLQNQEQVFFDRAGAA